VLKIGAVVAVVAFALVLGAWRIVMSDLPSFSGAGAARAAATAFPDPTMSRAAEETFVVPSPSFVTPSLTAPLGPEVPEVLEPEATTAPGPPPPAPPAPPAAPPPATPTPTPQSNQLRNVSLACNQNNRRIVATLSFFSAEPVTVTLTAGQRSEASRQRGAVRIRLAGPAGQASTCSAVVAGRQVGPIGG
jgi:hypothetical protein